MASNVWKAAHDDGWWLGTELGGITIGWRELPTIYFDNLCLLLEHAQTPRNPTNPTTITRGA